MYKNFQSKTKQPNTLEKSTPMQNISKVNHTGIPDSMKTRYENLSGLSLDDVLVHYNSGNPAQLQSLAYTQGTHIYVGPGQEKHLGHELGHVVQQKQRIVPPIKHYNSFAINDDPMLEREADDISNGIIQKKPAKSMPDNSIIQKRENGIIQFITGYSAGDQAFIAEHNLLYISQAKDGARLFQAAAIQVMAPINAGGLNTAQQYFYRAMSLDEARTWLGGDGQIRFDGQQGWASGYNYSANGIYFNKTCPIILQIKASSFVGKMQSIKVTPTSEDGDLSWGVALTNKNGYHADDKSNKAITSEFNRLYPTFKTIELTNAQRSKPNGIRVNSATHSNLYSYLRNVCGTLAVPITTFIGPSQTSGQGCLTQNTLLTKLLKISTPQQMLSLLIPKDFKDSIDNIPPAVPGAPIVQDVKVAAFKSYP